MAQRANWTLQGLIVSDTSILDGTLLEAVSLHIFCELDLVASIFTLSSLTCSLRLAIGADRSVLERSSRGLQINSFIIVQYSYPDCSSFTAKVGYDSSYCVSYSSLPTTDDSSFCRLRF